MTTYYIRNEDGKAQKVDTENLIELYADGRWWGGRPIYFWMTKSGKRFFHENHSQWQGEHNRIDEVSREEMIVLLVDAVHPDRAQVGLKLMGADEGLEEVS